jgi:hypothetical protein
VRKPPKRDLIIGYRHYRADRAPQLRVSWVPRGLLAQKNDFASFPKHGLLRLTPLGLGEELLLRLMEAAQTHRFFPSAFSFSSACLHF